MHDDDGLGRGGGDDDGNYDDDDNNVITRCNAWRC